MKLRYKCQYCLKEKTEKGFIKGYWNECRSCVYILLREYGRLVKKDK